MDRSGVEWRGFRDYDAWENSQVPWPERADGGADKKKAVVQELKELRRKRRVKRLPVDAAG